MGTNRRDSTLGTNPRHLILLAVGAIAFLSTQGEEVLQTWVTYLTGLAGSVLGLIQLFSRRSGGSEPKSQTT